MTWWLFHHFVFSNYKPTLCQQRLGALSYPTALLVWISGSLIVNDSQTKTKKLFRKKQQKDCTHPTKCGFLVCLSATPWPSSCFFAHTPVNTFSVRCTSPLLLGWCTPAIMILVNESHHFHYLSLSQSNGYISFLEKLILCKIASSKTHRNCSSEEANFLQST